MSISLLDCTCPCSSVQYSETDICKSCNSKDAAFYRPLYNSAGETVEEIPLLLQGSKMVIYDSLGTDYEVMNAIGCTSDGTGAVFAAHHIASNTTVAVKKYYMDKCRNDVFIREEVAFARQLRHPSVVPVLNTFVVGPELWVLMPIMAYGSARDLIEGQFKDGLPELAIAFILRDVLQALDYLHTKGIIHRSIRASHILISETGKAFLSGFKYGYNMIQRGKWQRIIHDFPKGASANLNWLSPEILEQNLHGYNEKSDIYSLGITTCEIANGVVPFAGMSSTLILTEKIRGSTPQLLDSRSLSSHFEEEQNPVHHTDSGVGDSVASTANVQQKELAVAQSRRFSDNFHNFVELCLQREPSLRPRAYNLLNQAFFKQCRKSGVKVNELLRPIKPLGAPNLLDNDYLGTLRATGDISLCDSVWDF